VMGERFQQLWIVFSVGGWLLCYFVRS